jgi:heat shock protein HslJ
MLAVGIPAGCGSLPAGGDADASNRAPVATGPRDTVAPRALQGTRWRLVSFTSMDDAVGVIRPSDPALYTLALNADGSATLRLDCNRAQGDWRAEPGADGASGRFAFGPLAATQALCPPPSLHERLARDLPFVRGYRLNEGQLHLSLMADAGIYAWEPEPK